MESVTARLLRRTLEVGGVVATAAGLHTVLTGGKSFPPWREADSMVESELRFYSAFYVAYGLHVLRTARREDVDAHAVNEIAAALLLAGLGRACAWRAVGKPHPFQRALLAIELAAPPAFVVASARLRRNAG
jgi:Domain of unknown function (DUF4345)